MSILSVDNISPIGSGTSVTVNSAATLVLTNANSTGVVTATSFVGSGANLTGVLSNIVEDTSPQLGANLDTNTKCIDFGDSNTGTVNRLRFGASTDFEIFHNGTNNHIDCHTAGQDLYIRPTKDVYIQDYSTDDIFIKMIKDGAVELYHNDSKKLETTTDGVQVTGEVVSGTLHCSGKLDLPDSPNATVGRVLLGDSDDLQLYHASNISTIKDNYGDLRILSNTLRLQPLVGNENFLYAIEGGTTRLFYDGATKFETISTGINVTGGVRIGGNNAANELDDYEEGSWTVGVDARLVTGSEGYYTKIGRLVICQFILNGLNAQTTGANISGIPFTSKNSNQIGLCTIGDVSGVSYSSGSSDIYGRVNANATNVQLLSKTTNGTSHSSTTFTLQTNVVLRGYIMYMTD